MLKILHNFVPFGEKLLAKTFLPLEIMLRENIRCNKTTYLRDISIVFIYSFQTNLKLTFFKAGFNF